MKFKLLIFFISIGLVAALAYVVLSSKVQIGEEKITIFSSPQSTLQAEEAQKVNDDLFKVVSNKTYSGSDDTGYFFIDVFDESKHSKLLSYTKRNLSANKTLQSIFDRYKVENVQYLPEAEVMIVKKRANIRNFPIEVADTKLYDSNPYFYKLSSDSKAKPILDNGVTIFAGMPVILLAKISLTLDDGSKVEYSYIRSNTIEGFMRSSDLVKFEEDTLLNNPLEPVENIKMMGDRGARLGIVKVFGLKIEENQLVRVDKYSGNSANPKNGIAPEENESFEAWGDGIIETGESAILSLGDVVEIVEEKDSTYVIQAVDKQKLEVDKSFVNVGYLEPTKENVDMFFDEYAGAAYSWGGKDGLGNDCSGFIDQIYRSFGYIVGGRGGYPQMFGRGDKVFKIAERTKSEEEPALAADRQDFKEFLPKTKDELASRLQKQGFDIDELPLGFSYLSWGDHVMVISDFDDDGNIIYTHSVGPARDFKGKNDFKVFRTLRSGAVIDVTEDGKTRQNTFSPILPFEKIHEINLVVVI